jgi:peptidoglycan/LPS O-acetylase OafA/YrhL
MQKSETFTALNGLRFLAALAVVIFHYAPRTDGYTRLPAAIKNLIDEGPAAVSFFFILSGFVLAYRYLERGDRLQSRAAFYWARLVRLYPAYLLAFLLFLPVAMQQNLGNSFSLSAGRHRFELSALLSGLMLQAWTPLAQAWNGPSWSLSVEAFMYLLFPFIGFRLMRLSPQKTIFVFFASWLIPVSFASAYECHRISPPIWRAYITNNPLLWLPLFVMGICATCMVPTWRSVRADQARKISTAAFAALILAVFLWPHQWNDVLVTGGVAPLFAVVVVCFTRRASRIAKVIGAALPNHLGEASFALYILQAPVWHYWQEFTNHLRRIPEGTSMAAIWQIAFFVPFLILVSLATQRLVENPLRAWLRDRRSSQPERDLRFQTIAPGCQAASPEPSRSSG